MARVMADDCTEIYRMRVTRQFKSGSQVVEVYGPHAQSNQARNYDVWDSRTPRREEKQSLRPDENNQLYWDTIRTAYYAGGENVNWDA